MTHHQNGVPLLAKESAQIAHAGTFRLLLGGQIDQQQLAMDVEVGFEPEYHQ